MTDVTPDPRPPKRVKNLDRIKAKMATEVVCRSCGGGHYRDLNPLEAHHLVPRAQSGQDTEDNIIGLCRDCHHIFTHSHVTGQRERIGIAIRKTMTISEHSYIVVTKNEFWLDWKYPKTKGVLPEGMTDPSPGQGRQEGDHRAPSPSESTSKGSGMVPSRPVPEARGEETDLSLSTERGQSLNAAAPPPPGNEPVSYEELAAHLDVVTAEPGQPCPTCKRRFPHEKKKTSPVSKVFSHRGPLDTEDDYREILEAALKHGGMAGEEKFFLHEGILRMCAVVLAGPPGTLVKAP